MTQEHKELILIDLSARLPYGAMVLVKGEKYFNEIIEPYTATLSFGTYLFDDEDITLVPYLRPLSSMTEEERLKLKEWIFVASDTKGKIYFDGFRNISAEDTIKAIDYLNAHYFDYRGLIEKGLALEAPEDMYKL